MTLRKKQFDNKSYEFREDTKEIRDNVWEIENIPKNLSRRYVRANRSW